jgi:cell shape-determining protein MreC
VGIQNVDNMNLNDISKKDLIAYFLKINKGLKKKNYFLNNKIEMLIEKVEREDVSRKQNKQLRLMLKSIENKNTDLIISKKKLNSLKRVLNAE